MVAGAVESAHDVPMRIFVIVCGALLTAALAACAPSVQPLEGPACLYELTPRVDAGAAFRVRTFDTERDCNAYRAVCNARRAERCSGCCSYCPE